MAERTCSVEGCDRRHYGRGLCSAHLQRLKRGAPLDPPILAPTSRPAGTAERVCTHPGCEAKHYARGYCRVHHSRWRFGQDMDAPIRERRAPGVTVSCSECERPARSLGLCSGHYMRQYVRKTLCSIDGCGAPEHARGYCQMHYGILSRFTLAPERWEEMYSAQEGRCKICAREMTRSQANTDHDHACCPSTARSCGRCVRGLLCVHCNHAIARMGDDPARLRAAAQYLEEQPAAGTTCA